MLAHIASLVLMFLKITSLSLPNMIILTATPTACKGSLSYCKPSGFIHCFHLFDGCHSSRYVAKFMVVLICIPMMVGTVSSF